MGCAGVKRAGLSGLQPVGRQASEKVKLTSSEDVLVFGVRSVCFHLHFFLCVKVAFTVCFPGDIANIHSFRRIRSYRKKDKISAVPQIQKTVLFIYKLVFLQQNTIL